MKLLQIVAVVLLTGNQVAVLVREQRCATVVIPDPAISGPTVVVPKRMVRPAAVIAAR